MLEEENYASLVRQAQQGQADAKDRLAREVEPRVRAYIYRVTLDKDITEDLAQDTMLQMVKSLEDLRDAEHFWPWLWGVANSKVQEYYRNRKRKAAISASVFYEDFLAQQPDRREKDGLRNLLREELSRTVMAAMKEIKQQYRAVLSLRCFERLAYPEIAVALKCNEIKARVLFYRAKQALKRELMRQGVSKSLLVMCLGMFGKLTAPAEAAPSSIAVAPGSTKVGLTGVVLGTAATKVGLTIIAAAVVTVAMVGGYSTISSDSPLTPRSQVRSFHYTAQVHSSGVTASSSLSRGAYEQWYYFPDGIEGTHFVKIQRWNPQMTHKLCAWLQDDQCNYFYHEGEEKVYINNYRQYRSDLRVRRLPTDPPEFTSYLSLVEGELKGVEYTRDKTSGLLLQAVDRRFAEAPLFKTTYEYNSLDGQQFQYYWPDSVPLDDRRDKMHKRGWTYFRVQGQIDGRSVAGRGRIPFVYSTFKKYPPWIVLDIGDDLRVTDCNAGARLYGSGGVVNASYPAGTFFEGLARPWMGMHTIDIIRRDAAQQRIWFDTDLSGNSRQVIVTLLGKGESKDIQIKYTIDIDKDIIESIRFKTGNRDAGLLTFVYLEQMGVAQNEFAEPVLPDDTAPARLDSPGMLWLFDLAQAKTFGREP